MNSNLKLESSVLGCMLIDYECAKEYGHINLEDYTSDAHKAIHEAIEDLVKDNKQPDYLNVFEKLNQQVPLKYLIDTTESVATTLNFKTYVEQLKDLTLKRRLFQLGDTLKDGKLSGKEISELVEKEIFKIRETIQTEDFIPIKNLVLGVFKDINERYETDGLSGLSTGYQKLDEMTDGLQKQNLIYLAARPSMGKTALAINIAQNVSNNGNKVAIFSLEMSKEEIVKRMLLSEAKIGTEHIKNKKINDNGWQRLGYASNRIFTSSNIFICDRPGLTVSNIQSMCRRLKREKGLDLIIIDYLQMIKSSENGSRREQVEAVSRDLKALAKEIDVPVIVISSLSRAGANRANNKPLLTDLRETGQIEYDADIVMFIHREEYYEPTEENKGEAEIIFAKQRNGPVGIVKLGWIASYTRFIDYNKLEKMRGKQ